MSDVHASTDLPAAELAPRGGVPLVWIVPVVAAVLAVVLGWQSWSSDGRRVSVQFDDGHGLKTADTVRHRGIVVGRVADLRLATQGTGVVVELVLDPGAEHLTRVGSRFWIVRPEFGLDAIAGLDTLVGDHYVGVLPGSGPLQDHFEGLPRAPIADALEPGLEVVLEGARRGSLVAGSPVQYRGIRVGTVLGVALASDGRTVESTVRIQQSYASLVRPGTRFWDSGGIAFEVGLTGLRLELDSLRSVTRGGVSLATPEPPADPVPTGYRFTLHEKPEASWLAWQPSVPIGHSLLPAGAPLPQPVRAALTWTEGRFLSDDERLEGWGLPVGGKLLLPADLVVAPEDAHADSARLEVSGSSAPLPDPVVRPAAGLALIDLPAVEGLRPWSREYQRRPEGPEDCLLVGDPSTPPRSVAAGRFTDDGAGWVVDGGLPLDARWHGAAVIARRDGRLVGLLLIDEARELRRVATLEGPVP